HPLAALNGTQYARVYGTDNTAARISRQYVSANYFDVAGVRAIRGRGFEAADSRTVGASPVAVISHRYWTSRLGSDENVVGRSLTIDDHVFTIIGVSAPGFTGVEAGRATDVWLPAMMMGPCVTDPGCQVYRLMGRLQRGVSAGAPARDGGPHVDRRAAGTPDPAAADREPAGCAGRRRHGTAAGNVGQPGARTASGASRGDLVLEFHLDRHVLIFTAASRFSLRCCSGSRPPCKAPAPT